MKRIALGMIAALTLLFGCQAKPYDALKRYEASFIDVFDTVTQVVVYDMDEASAKRRVARVHDELTAYHRLYDVYNEYEGVANLRTVNQNAGVRPVAVDDRLIDLIAYAKRLFDITDGSVNIAMGGALAIWHEYRQKGIDDPEHAALPPMVLLEEAAKHSDIDDVVVDRDAGTVYLADAGMRLDVGAIAKGYAVQRVAEQMRKEGVSSMLISVGGNVCAINHRADGADWRVAVQDPGDMGGSVCVLNVNDQSLVTSGAYQRYYTVNGVRYHHIIDPDTLMPATGVASVSVLCADSALADGLSTALFILPQARGLSLIESMDGVEALWINEDGTQTRSKGFDAYIVS